MAIIGMFFQDGFRGGWEGMDVKGCVFVTYSVQLNVCHFILCTSGSSLA